MNNKIIVIGANEFQKKMVTKANELGYETHVFAWEEGAAAKDEAHFFYPVSITEKDKILSYGKKIKPVGICSIASDLAMPTVNYIANKLGLVANSLECTELTTNKFKMRTSLSKAELPCPKYQLVKDFKDICGIMEFPLIIKPIDRSGSRGVYKVNNINEINEAIVNARNVSFVEEVLVEEYIEGKEYSIECISQNGQHSFLQVTEKFTTGSPNFIEKGHLAPARLTDDMKNDIVKIIKKSLDVLKVQNGPSHSEVKITPRGEIKIIEIAARMGGDFIGSDMVYISTGFDFLRNTINVAVKKEINLNHSPKDKMAIVGFIFNSADKQRFEKLKKMHSNVIKEYEIKENMNSVQDSSSRNGYYILEVDSDKILIEVLKILNMEE